VLFHDELEENYFPISFTDFTAHAASHGLKYLAEANIFDMESSKFSPDLQKQIEEYSGGDRHLREQYMDFVRCRKFRQTLLCHDSAAIRDTPDSRCVCKLYAASSATPDSADPDFSGNTVEAFKGYMGAAMKTAHPLAKTAIGRLIERWPQAIHFSELLALCRETLGAAADPEALEQIVFTTYRVGLVELHAHAPGCVARAGARPATTALARYQAQHGRTITTMRHTSIEATGQVERRLLTLLDGTRDRVALAAELAATMHAAPSPEKLLPDLDKNLARLARFGLLVA
jgi:methyltransferase-like protein